MGRQLFPIIVRHPADLIGHVGKRCLRSQKSNLNINDPNHVSRRVAEAQVAVTQFSKGAPK